MWHETPWNNPLMAFIFPSTFEAYAGTFSTVWWHLSTTFYFFQGVFTLTGFLESSFQYQLKLHLRPMIPMNFFNELLASKIYTTLFKLLRSALKLSWLRLIVMPTFWENYIHIAISFFEIFEKHLFVNNLAHTDCLPNTAIICGTSEPHRWWLHLWLGLLW